MDCPALPLVPRGDVEIVDDGLLAKIECDADYILVFGDDRLTCNWRIGEWQGTIPRCILACELIEQHLTLSENKQYTIGGGGG